MPPSVGTSIACTAHLGGKVSRFYIIGLLILALAAHLFDFGGLAEVLLALAGIVAMGVLLFTLARTERDRSL
jgi:hypothetical protein